MKKTHLGNDHIFFQNCVLIFREIELSKLKLSAIFSENKFNNKVIILRNMGGHR